MTAKKTLNDVKHVKFIALSRLSDKKTILTLNPNILKKQFNHEYNVEVRNNVEKIMNSQVTLALKSGNWSDRYKGRQGTWYSHVYFEPADIVFSILMDSEAEILACKSLLEHIVCAIREEVNRKKLNL